MRDHVKRLLMVPFSFGCVSDSSVAVGKNEPKIQSKGAEHHHPITKRVEMKERKPSGRMKNMRSILVPKSGVFQGLIKRLRSFSQLFVCKEELDEMEKEMEIGFPTDVKHVTHMGWDGSTKINPTEGWENLNAPEILSFPSVSVRQFGLAMAAQAAPTTGSAAAVSSTNIA